MGPLCFQVSRASLPWFDMADVIDSDSSRLSPACPSPLQRVRRPRLVAMGPRWSLLWTIGGLQDSPEDFGYLRISRPRRGRASRINGPPRSPSHRRSDLVYRGICVPIPPHPYNAHHLVGVHYPQFFSGLDRPGRGPCHRYHRERPCPRVDWGGFRY